MRGRVAILSLIFFGMLPAAAAAAKTPAGIHLSWSIASNQVDAGTGPTITYSVTGLVKGERFYLDRRVGTGQVWQAVATLPLKNGSGAVVAPPLQQGAFRYRLAVYNSRHRLARVSTTKSVYSYATVSLLTIASGSTQTVQVGDQLFTYVASDSSGTNIGQTNTILSMQRTTCRAIMLQVATTETVFGDGTGTSGGSTLLSLIQQSADPQSLTVDGGTTATFSGSLNGGPWALEDSTTAYELDAPDGDSF